MTNVQNYRPLSCPFLLPMLLGAIFQQLQAYMGVHSGRERPKNFFPYYRKNNALKFKNKEKKKNQNNWKQSKVWLFQSTVSSGTLCCNYLHIPDSQTDVVQSFVVDFVEHITSVPTGTHLACFQAE